VDGLWATKSEDVGLIVREISFEGRNQKYVVYQNSSFRHFEISLPHTRICMDIVSRITVFINYRNWSSTTFAVYSSRQALTATSPKLCFALSNNYLTKTILSAIILRQAE